jgi:hypothetical protein
MRKGVKNIDKYLNKIFLNERVRFKSNSLYRDILVRGG